jgi:hypothetical protein
MLCELDGQMANAVMAEAVGDLDPYRHRSQAVVEVVHGAGYGGHNR